jgi:hypothetical protein
LLRLQEIFSNVQHYMLRAVTTASKRSRQAQIADDEDSLKHRPRLGVVCDNGQNSMLSKNVHFALPFFGDENPARRIASGVRICVRQISAFWIS